MTFVAAVVAGGCAIAMLLGRPSGTDLSAQQAWAHFAARHPVSPVNLSWFGGVQSAAYSMLSPYVMALVGVRLTGALAAVVSAVLFALLLGRWQLPRAGWAAAWAAVGFVADVVDGRVTFALGLAVGLAALASVPVESSRRWRWLPAVLLAALCTCTSPVAGLFLILACLGWALRRRVVAWLSLAAAVPLGVIAVALPQPANMPDTWAIARPDLLAAAAVVLLCRGLVVRTVAAVYGLIVLVVFLDPGPVGSNIERLAVLFTGPVLICCWRWHRALLVVALVVVASWVVRVPLRDLSQAHQVSIEVAASHRLVSDLRPLGPMTGRVEVVPFRDHGEAAVVAASWPLARGWERQLDTVRAATLYDGTLTPGRYLTWLRANAVQYVALGHHAHDFGALHELRLLQHPPAYLVPVHVDPEWTIWRVSGSTPIVGAPGRLVTADQASLEISAAAPSTIPVNVRWTRWWHVSGGATVSRQGQLLAIRVPRAETVRLTSSY